MSKVYIYSQKFFKQLAVLIVSFGVLSCASSNTTAATSGETDGVYYSPSKDGRVQSSYDQPESNAYDIQVGSPYFDANGNGAEDFYYEEQTADNGTEDVNIYSGGSNYVISGTTTDWGRYDGLDITINNYGWHDPWWGWGYNYWGWGSSWRFGWGWNSPYYGWGGWYGYNPYWGNPYWGWGGWYGYNPYWGNPYWGGGYYGYYGYYGNGYYHRGTRINPGVRPGNYLANGSPYRGYSPYRNQNNGLINNVRPTRNGNATVRNGNISSENTPVRPVREGVKENPRNSMDTGNTPVRNTRNGEIKSNSEGNVRPVRQTMPDNVRPNVPTRTNQNIRQNSNIRNNDTRSNSNIRSNSSPRSNSNIKIRSNSNMNSNSNMRSNSRSNSNMRSGNTSGGMRGGSSSGGVRSGGRR